MSNNNYNNQHRNNNDPRFRDQNKAAFNHTRDAQPIASRDISENSEVEHVPSEEPLDLNVAFSGVDLGGQDTTVITEVVSEPEPMKYKNDTSVTERVVVVNCKKVNVRSAPDKMQDNVLFEAEVGREFNLVSETDTWFKVQSIEIPFAAGYIMKEFADRISK